MKTIKVGGMSCQHCVQSVTKALSAFDGLANIKVDLKKGEATYEETKPVDPAALAEAIRKIGFTVE